MTAAISRNQAVTNLSNGDEASEYAFLAPARARFRALTVDRILELEAYRQLATQEATADAGLTAIRDLTHKIRGVAATLGFPEAGDLAALVEQKIIDSFAAKLPPTDAIQLIAEPLEALLSAMEAILE